MRGTAETRSSPQFKMQFVGSHLSFLPDRIDSQVQAQAIAGQLMAVDGVHTCPFDAAKLKVISIYIYICITYITFVYGSRYDESIV